jgi:hypothetical protein
MESALSRRVLKSVKIDRQNPGDKKLHRSAKRRLSAMLNQSKMAGLLARHMFSCANA